MANMLYDYQVQIPTDFSGWFGCTVVIHSHFMVLADSYG